ncbi:hypothetical protein A0256_01035 [Mucilaginibacter sp. PAMC 26640]|nr:hypothetical protein A0256_01035 [Mucilaginibacter sp. PAMC 26640]
MEWVYDNKQKEKEILNAYLERFTLLKGVGICSQSTIRKVGFNGNIIFILTSRAEEIIYVGHGLSDIIASSKVGILVVAVACRNSRA